MAQYISKDAVKKEIKQLQSCTMDINMDFFSEEAKGEYNALSTIDYFINTLDVKEVDLGKEIDRVWDNTSNNFLEDGWKEFKDIAKHFFELGLHCSQIDDGYIEGVKGSYTTTDKD